MLKTILFLLFYLLLTPYNWCTPADLEHKECYLLLYLSDVVGAECATLEVFFFSTLSVHRSVCIILAVLWLSEMEVSPLCSDEDQRATTAVSISRGSPNES